MKLTVTNPALLPTRAHPTDAGLDLRSTHPTTRKDRAMTTLIRRYGTTTITPAGEIRLRGANGNPDLHLTIDKAQQLHQQLVHAIDKAKRHRRQEATLARRRLNDHDLAASLSSKERKALRRAGRKQSVPRSAGVNIHALGLYAGNALTPRGQRVLHQLHPSPRGTNGHGSTGK